MQRLYSIVRFMKPEKYSHPERLDIPRNLVLGSPKDWEVIEVLTTQATMLKTEFFMNKPHAYETETIEIALLMPKKIEAGRGFEMLLAQIHEIGLTTLAAQVVKLEYHGEFSLYGTGFTGVYFDTDRPGLIRATNEYRNMGHTQKIDTLKSLLIQHKDVLTAQPGYLPAWQDTARKLAPAVAAFFQVQPEEQPVV